MQWTGERETVDCHTCNMKIPKAYLKEHTGSGIHLTNSKIISIALERSKILVTTQTLSSTSEESTNDNYCEVCNSFYDILAEHLNSEQHEQLKIFEAASEIMCDLFEKPQKILDVICKFKKIVNDRTFRVKPVVKEAISKKYCDICKVYKATQGFDGHLKSKKHKKNALAILYPSDEASTASHIEKIYCDICKVHKSKQGFDKHLKCTKHRKNARSKEVAAMLDIDHISSKTKIFCDDCSVYELIKDYEKHLNCEMHREKCSAAETKHKIYLYDNEDNNKEKRWTKSHVTKYVTNVLNSSDKYCTVCRMILNSYDEKKIIEHFESVGHLYEYNCILTKYNYVNKVSDEYFCTRCDSFFYNIIDHLKTRHYASINESYCEVCRVKLPARGVFIHKKGKRHSKNIENIDKPDIECIDIDLDRCKEIKKQLAVKQNYLTCRACETSLICDNEYIIGHFESPSHKSKLVIYLIENNLKPIAEGQYKCMKCSEIVKAEEAFEHVQNHFIFIAQSPEYRCLDDEITFD